MKNARNKHVHIVWLHLYDTLEQSRTIETEIRSAVFERGTGRGLAAKWQWGDFAADGNILYI